MTDLTRAATDVLAERECCKLCSHWNKLADGDWGHCRRFPPQTVSRVFNGCDESLETWWPATEASELCGEFKVRRPEIERLDRATHNEERGDT